jgi:hypothetical protein
MPYLQFVGNDVNVDHDVVSNGLILRCFVRWDLKDLVSHEEFKHSFYSIQAVKKTCV